jgi:hypothetical protein
MCIIVSTLIVLSVTAVIGAPAKALYAKTFRERQGRVSGRSSL